MSEQSRLKALAAAHCANEAVGALILHAREGGGIGRAERHDMVFPLADALRLGLEAVHDTADRMPDADNALLNAVQAWIEA